MAAAAANIVNIVLNYALVYGAGLGIAGSALGTVVAQWGAAAAYVYVVARAARPLLVSLRPDWSGVRESFTASAPLLVRNVSLRVVIAGASLVAARMGTAEIAAHQIAFNIWTTLGLALDAVAIAGQAIVGRYLGGGDVQAARGATTRMIEWSIGAGVLFALVLMGGRIEMTKLFTRDVEVRDLLASVLIVVAVLQPLAGWVFALDGVLIGAGDMRYIAIAQAATVVVFAPLAAAVLVLDLGLTDLWWRSAPGW